MTAFDDRLYRSILKQATKKGAAVSFADGGTPAYDETSETPTPTPSNIAGFAVEIPTDPEELIALEVITKEPVTLIFAPTTVGQAPTNGNTVLWSGKVRTVKGRFLFRPSGTILGAKLILI